MSSTHAPAAPTRRLSGDARRWAAAREAYLAGADAESVCRRHDIRTAYFLRRAQEQGWRRTDPPAPAPPPDASPPKHGDAPPLLTAAQMADKAWSMLQAAMAAGRLIEARGWLRLHKDLQPYVREEAVPALRCAAAGMTRRASGEGIGLGLDCFSTEESNTPDPAHAPPVIPETPPGVIRDGMTRRTSGEDIGLGLDCFSPEQSNTPNPAHAPLVIPETPPGVIRDGMTRRISGEGIRLALDCFSPTESNSLGP